MTNDVAFVNGIQAAYNGLTAQLENVAQGIDIGDFIDGLLVFAAVFLAIWGTWVGIRAILRSGRLVK